MRIYRFALIEETLPCFYHNAQKTVASTQAEVVSQEQIGEVVDAEVQTVETRALARGVERAVYCRPLQRRLYPTQRTRARLRARQRSVTVTCRVWASSENHESNGCRSSRMRTRDTSEGALRANPAIDQEQLWDEN